MKHQTTERLDPFDILLEHVLVSNKRVLDVGCGDGSLVRFLRSEGADVTGVECNEAARKQAVEADPVNSASYIDAVGQDLPFPEGSFDAVIFSLSLHHVPTPDRGEALREAHRVLRPSGNLFVLEPISSGPGHDVFAPVIDETVICAEVEDLLKDPDGFVLERNGSFTTSWVYESFASAEADVVGIDSERAADFAANRETVRELFERLGEPTANGIAFAQPIRYWLFSPVVL